MYPFPVYLICNVLQNCLRIVELLINFFDPVMCRKRELNNLTWDETLLIVEIIKDKLKLSRW